MKIMEKSKKINLNLQCFENLEAVYIYTHTSSLINNIKNKSINLGENLKLYLRNIKLDTG